MRGAITGAAQDSYATMVAALRERDVRRTVSWLKQSGGLMPMPREAGDLLAVRLAADRRIRVPWDWAVGITAVAVMVGPTWALVTGDDAGLDLAVRHEFPALAVDERLRSGEAIRALRPLGALAFLALGSPSSAFPGLPGWLAAGMYAGFIVAMFAVILMGGDQPWQNGQASGWLGPVTDHAPREGS